MPLLWGPGRELWTPQWGPHPLAPEDEVTGANPRGGGNWWSKRRMPVYLWIGEAIIIVACLMLGQAVFWATGSHAAETGTLFALGGTVLAAFRAIKQHFKDQD